MEQSSVVSASSSMNFATGRLNGSNITDALRLAPSGGGGGASSSTKYSRLASEPDSPVRSTGGTSAFLQQQQRQQQMLLQHQDQQLGQMSDSVGNLRNVSTAIGRELDEQAVCHFSLDLYLGYLLCIRLKQVLLGAFRNNHRPPLHCVLGLTQY